MFLGKKNLMPLGPKNESCISFSIHCFYIDHRQGFRLNITGALNDGVRALVRGVSQQASFLLILQGGGLYSGTSGPWPACPPAGSIF